MSDRKQMSLYDSEKIVRWFKSGLNDGFGQKPPFNFNEPDFQGVPPSPEAMEAYTFGYGLGERMVREAAS
jgi:hypothetical protein